MTALAPVARVREVGFADGSMITFRPIGIDDGWLVSSFLAQLSPESEYKRFLHPGGRGHTEWVAGLITADQVDSVVYGAFAHDRFGESLVAVAESIRNPLDPERAEFALAAIDPWQNMGIGTIFGRFLAGVVREAGVRFWEAYMLADNRQMTRVLSRLGRRVEYVVESEAAYALLELEPIRP